MRKALRATAMAIAAGSLAAMFGCAASRPDRAGTRASVPAASSVAPEPDSGAAGRITQAAFTEDPDGARLVLSSDAPLLYTAYEPRPDLLVVDLPGFAVSEAFTTPEVSGSLVQSVRFEPISEMGKSLVRLTVSHREGTRYDVRSLGRGLAIAFDDPAAAAGQPAPEPAAPIATADLVPQTAPARPVASTEVAHVLEEVVAAAAGESVEIALLGDGALPAKDFVLANPPRIVIDLPGVKNEFRKRTLAVNSELVSRVRISQFATSPELITRIVVDLARPSAYSLRPDGERLALIVGGSAGGVGQAPPLVPIPAPVPTAAVEASSEPASPPVADLPVSRRPAPDPDPAPLETGSAPSVTRIAEAPAPSTESKPPAPAPILASADSPAVPPVAESAAATPPASVNPAPVGPGVPTTVPPAPPLSAPASEPPAPRRFARPIQESPSPAPQRGNALFEAAAAVLDQQEASRPEAPGTYQPRTISESQVQFTGEPISLDLKDADIKDVFRTISELTGLNIVVDPEVRGTVTVKLEDVPWDQALDLILKQNGLGYVLENNIMRIATTAKLQAEQADRSRLSDARQAAEPTRTVIKKLSYATAADITPTLKSVMSRRGDIVVDGRTNTLIIREIPTFMPAVLQLIENLDTATPQVMIEARIVETTKTLGRSLGINWGFTGAADVAHGNPTGLIFPNNIAGEANIDLGAGPTVAAIRLGNILDTFSLDIALTAAENQGLLKIISSPKVAALTNTEAVIQSGVQIPVQTNVNNTTTVIYVDATLQLTVTPQITNEGTILLNLNIQKREPAVALNLSLGQNVPLTIRQYRGDVLVRDGGTTVIGGIFQINDQDQNNMIPGLWKIPILGNLFRNKTRTERHDELLIFITPRILRS